VDAEGRRLAEAEAGWKADRQKLAEAEAEVERLRASGSAPSPPAAAEAGAAASTGAGPLPVYGGAYLDKIVGLLERGKESAGADACRTEQLSRQAHVLARLKAAMAARGAADAGLSDGADSGSGEGGSGGAEGRGVGFDAGVDDDEVLLRLFRELDTDGDGAISPQELLDAPLLKEKENAEMARVLWRAVGCDVQALEEALAPLDRGAAVKAVFEAIGPSLHAAAPPHAGRAAAGGAGEGDGRAASRADLERFLGAPGAPAQGSALAAALQELAASLPEGGQLDFLGLKEAARKVPRVAAQRLEWVRTMGLDAALARHLPPGTLDDGSAAPPERAALEACGAQWGSVALRASRERGGA
jgi:hypothetical protein